MRQQKVSPRQFDIMQREMQRAELEGHSPATCVVFACNATGIKPPKAFETVNIVVDPTHHCQLS
jgi:hypothetical protein